MTRTDAPRRHLSVMTILTLSLGLVLGALTLWAQPEGDAGEPRGEATSPGRLRISLHEALRLLEESRSGSLRRVPSESGGELLVIEYDRPTSASPICLARPAGGGPDPCAVGEAISRMPACREPGGCQAYEIWSRVYGTPRSLPALSPERPDATDDGD